jgi:hypothetical protein
MPVITGKVYPTDCLQIATHFLLIAMIEAVVIVTIVAAEAQEVTIPEVVMATAMVVIVMAETAAEMNKNEFSYPYYFAPSFYL